MVVARYTTAKERFDEAMILAEHAARMTDRGWAVWEERRLAHAVRLTSEIAQAKDAFQTIAGVSLTSGNSDDEDDEEFDDKLFNSAPQLKVLFFDKWGVKPKYYSKETGKAKLDKNALKDLLAEGQTQQVRDAARWLLRFREAHKTKSTYIDRLAKDHPKTYLSKLDGLLRPSWHVIQALTGRWSSSEPNLQNLQKPVLNDKKEVIRPGTRDILIAKPGLFLLEGDYSQLELRIIALLAGDETLIEMFAAKGVDMHMENAKILFNTASPTKNERDLAKTFVYGSNYGGSAKTIWKQIVAKFPNVTEADVGLYQERWFKAHPWIKAFTSGAFKVAKNDGRVIEWLTGREFIFYLRQVKHTEPANYLVQGFAAAMMNRATVEIGKKLNWVANEGMLAQVHDAAFLEGPDLKKLAQILRSSMEMEFTIGGHTMKFPIDLKAGNCWGEMKDLKEAA